jgi:hypothetical protein
MDTLLKEELIRIKSMMGIITEIKKPIKDYTTLNGWIQTGSHCDSPESYSDNIKPTTQYTDDVQNISKENITYEYYKVINPEKGLCNSKNFNSSIEVKTHKKCIKGTAPLSFTNGDAVLKVFFKNDNTVEQISIEFCQNTFTEQEVKSICSEYNGNSDFSDKFYCSLNEGNLSTDQLTTLVNRIENLPVAQNTLNNTNTPKQPTT